MVRDRHRRRIDGCRYACLDVGTELYRPSAQGSCSLQCHTSRGQTAEMLGERNGVGDHKGTTPDLSIHTGARRLSVYLTQPLGMTPFEFLPPISNRSGPGI